MTVENAGIEDELFDYIINTIEATPFYNLLDIKVSKIGPGFAELTVISGSQHTNPLGVIHGGLYMSLADAAMGNAIRSLGIKGVTVDCSTGFLSAAPLGETVTARGRVLKAGKNMIFAEAEVYSNERLLATTKATFFNTGKVSLESQPHK